jgi:hypothetical protein
MRFAAMALLVTVGMLTTSPANALPPDSGPMAPEQAAVPLVWFVELVAKGKVGQYSSIQVDDAGWPHIAFYDFGNGDLKYAFKDGSGWHIETVDSEGNVGGYTSLALDELGQANISYCRLAVASYTQCDDLKYAIRLNGTWANHTQTVDSDGNVGAYSSLAVEGGPDYEDMAQHISYYDQTNQQLKYCWGTGAFWTCGVADTDGDVGRYSSMVVASSRPYIAYQHVIGISGAELKYTYKDGSVWHPSMVDGPGVNTGGFSSLDLCEGPVVSPPTPHIGYIRNGRLGYAYFWLSPTIPHWEQSTVDPRSPRGISFKLDAICNPHMSFYDSHTGVLRYYRSIAGQPQFEVVRLDGSLDPNAYTSLALDDLGQPHISFYADSVHGDLLYAHKVPGIFLPLIMRP